MVGMRNIKFNIKFLRTFTSQNKKIIYKVIQNVCVNSDLIEAILSLLF